MILGKTNLMAPKKGSFSVLNAKKTETIHTHFAKLMIAEKLQLSTLLKIKPIEPL